MRELIEYIENQNLSTFQLVEEMNEHYIPSKALYKRLHPAMKDLYIIEENGMTDFAHENYVYLLYPTETKKSFKKRYVEERDDYGKSALWDFIIDHIDDLYKIEYSKYQYRAYKRVLQDRLSMMDYNYYNDPEL